MNESKSLIADCKVSESNNMGKIFNDKEVTSSIVLISLICKFYNNVMYFK